MKIYFIFFAAIALMPLACKKDIDKIEEIKETKGAATAGKVICTGNTWQLSDIFYQNMLSHYGQNKASLVYNNKLYVFDQSQNAVRIFDGNDWSNKRSNIPFPLAYGSGDAEFGFTLGNKGYLAVVGYYYDSNNNVKWKYDFWEYNFINNSWKAAAAYPPGISIDGKTVSTFSIGNKGYVVCGNNGFYEHSNQTWEYNQATDSWIQKAPCPSRIHATGFSIGNKGYIINGAIRFSSPDEYVYFRGLLEYNPATDTWSNKGYDGLFPGEGRSQTTVFVIDGKAYAGGGYKYHPSEGTTVFSDYYRYNPSSNSWTKIADFPPSNRQSFGFALNGRGYAVFYAAPNTNNNNGGMLKYTPLSCN